ncbi:succinic semialdehyde dehydrogenase [Meredithblackwellia eburnea MCA 4105]
MSAPKLSAAAAKLASELKDPSLLSEVGLINGKLVAAKSGKTFEVIDPATGDVLGNAADFTVEELTDAINVATKTFDTWRHSTPNVRSGILQKWRQLVLENKDDLARLITTENGKPIFESEGEVAYAASFLDWFAGEAMRLYGDFIPSPNPTTRTVVIRQPVGPVATICPWNFPIAMFAKKLAPVVAVGCTSILKPPPETPFSITAFALLAQRAGVPDGVINVLPTKTHTKDFGIEMCSNPNIKKVSFTGSTAVGKHLMELCAKAHNIRRITLELGGNSPFIVFDDADLELAIEGFLAGKFRANGENCCAPNRVLIQSGIHDRFVEALSAKMNSFKTGHGTGKGVTNGPLIHTVQRDKCKAFVDDMVSKGAKVVIGGKIPEDCPAKGAFYSPTLVTGVTSKMNSWRGEIFGPVAALTTFETEKEAVDMANDCEMGLAAYVYTTVSSNVARCWRIGEELDYGMVGINSGLVSAAEAPFGGKNNSGLGREGSKYAIDDFTDKKLLAWGGIKGAPLY